MSELPGIVLVNRSIILDNDRMLLMQRSAEDSNNPALWEFPGGKVDPGEDIALGLEREVKEETGLLVVPESRLVYVDDELIAGGKYAGKLYVALFHVSQYLSGEVQLSGEHTAFVWDTPEQARGRQLSAVSRRALLAYEEAGII